MNNDDFMPLKTGTNIISADLATIGKDLENIIAEQLGAGISSNPNDPWYAKLKFLLYHFGMKWDLEGMGYTMDFLPNGYENDYYGIGATILIRGHGNWLAIKLGS